MDFYFEGQFKNRGVVAVYMQNLIKELGLNRLRKPYIEVVFANKVDAYGLCEGDKDYAKIQIAKKCPVHGHKLSFMEQMNCLAHEMVHARQFLRGQLVAEGVWKWKGRNADGYEYDNQPWEKEAYRLEKELFYKCFPWYLPFNN